MRGQKPRPLEATGKQAWCARYWGRHVGHLAHATRGGYARFCGQVETAKAAASHRTPALRGEGGDDVGGNGLALANGIDAFIGLGFEVNLFDRDA